MTASYNPDRRKWVISRKPRCRLMRRITSFRVMKTTAPREIHSLAFLRRRPVVVGGATARQFRCVRVVQSCRYVFATTTIMLLLILRSWRNITFWFPNAQRNARRSKAWIILFFSLFLSTYLMSGTFTMMIIIIAFTSYSSRE